MKLTCEAIWSWAFVCWACFILYCFWLCHAACGILVPWPGCWTHTPALKGKVLTTGLPGKSLKYIFWSPFLFLLLEPLLCVGWHILYYPIEFVCCLYFFKSSFHCSDWVISYSVFQIAYHSSVSFSLLFIASRLVFISAMELSNFDWFIFIVSINSSLLQWSAFLLICFLIPLAFLLSSLWTQGLKDWWGLFHYFFFQGISFVLLIWNSFHAF